MSDVFVFRIWMSGWRPATRFNRDGWSWYGDLPDGDDALPFTALTLPG